MDTVIDRAFSYKILGVQIGNDLEYTYWIHSEKGKEKSVYNKSPYEFRS